MAVKRAATMPTPPSASKPAPMFAPGDKVSHAVFGEGVVVSAKQARGDTEVTVAFGAGQGVKRLMLNFAPMEKIEAADRAAEPPEELDESGIDPIHRPLRKADRDLDPFLDAP